MFAVHLEMRCQFLVDIQLKKGESTDDGIGIGKSGATYRRIEETICDRSLKSGRCENEKRRLWKKGRKVDEYQFIGYINAMDELDRPRVWRNNLARREELGKVPGNSWGKNALD